MCVLQFEKYLEMSWERSDRLPGEIHPREEGPEDLTLDLSPFDAAAELFDQ